MLNVYCIGTNAGELANYNSIFNIEGSTINMTSNVGGDVILINVPCKFYMNNSTVNSDYQGIIVRGGYSDYIKYYYYQYN